MSTVVDDSWIWPGGRAASSTSLSHSYPRVPTGKVAVWEGVREATVVLRHSLILAKEPGTVMASLR